MKTNRVRIIGGEWRSRIIQFPDGGALRPTPDRVRETLFNWLGQDLTGLTCLDLYAGSGALGFEAASRGAREVVLVEQDSGVCTALEANRTALAAKQTRLVRANALTFLRMDRGVYDVVFLDPPFASDPWTGLFECLSARLSATARVYRESGREVTTPPGFTVLKRSKAGQVYYQLLGRMDQENT